MSTKITTPCPRCGSHHYTHVTKQLDRRGPTVRVWKCRMCRLVKREIISGGEL